MCTVTPEQKIVLEDALPHELEMLQGSYIRLISPPSDPIVENALIECFCLHARQLLEFLNNKQGAPVRDFVDAAFQLQHITNLDNDLVTKLNTQIAHITYRRTAQQKDKINQADRKRLLEEIVAEMQNVANNLKAEFVGLLSLNVVQVPTIIVSTTASATNQIQIVRSGDTYVAHKVTK